MKTTSEYNKQGKLIHRKYSDGFEVWYEYNKKGNKIHTKFSDGYESWYE